MSWSSKILADRKGAALLTVLVALMIISLMLFEFQHTSMVERKQAYNQLHRVRAHYLAKSGANMGLLRVALYARAKKDGNLKSLLKGSLDSYLEQIWRLELPPFPPNMDDIKELSATDRTAYEKTLEETRIEEGTVDHTISTEQGLINLNRLQIPKNITPDKVDFRNNNSAQGPFFYVGRMLVNYIDELIKKSEDPYKEYGAIKPEEVVYDIMDWINPGNDKIMGGDKDNYYQQLDPPYSAKRHLFYTKDELKLVKGIDDHLYSKLEPKVTVYSEEGKIHINSAKKDIIKAIYPLLSDDDIKKLMEERKKRETENRIGWASVKDFVAYITDDLNYSDFTQYYPNENDYPFTISSRSFRIEGIGTIERSGSSIREKITLAVVLTNNAKVQVHRNIKNKADCKKGKDGPTRFWWPSTGQCFDRPNNEKECNLGVSGTWVVQGSEFCCKVGGLRQPICPAQSGSGTTKKAVEANAIKILFWSES